MLATNETKKQTGLQEEIAKSYGTKDTNSVILFYGSVHSTADILFPVDLHTSERMFKLFVTSICRCENIHKIAKLRSINFTLSQQTVTNDLVCNESLEVKNYQWRMPETS
jgi:hypothetical protein